MTTHPGLRHIGEHRAVIDRLEDNAKPAPCGWCQPDDADEATPQMCIECERVFTGHTLTMEWVTYLNTQSELAWGRLIREEVRWDASRDEVDDAHATWKRANNRARTALRLLVEDLARKATDARDARDHLIRERRATP